MKTKHKPPRGKKDNKHLPNDIEPNLLQNLKLAILSMIANVPK